MFLKDVERVYTPLVELHHSSVTEKILVYFPSHPFYHSLIEKQLGLLYFNVNFNLC